MKIYVLDGSPEQSVFGSDLASAYAKAASEAGHDVRLVRVKELSFDPILHAGYKVIQELEPDLIAQQEHLKWCEHLVLVSPVWWESVPAQVKGLFDRAILPGFAFKMHTDDLIPGWDKKLSGRSARIIYTQTIPFWYSILFRRDAFFQSLKQGIFEFVGIHPVRRTALNVLNADENLKKRYLMKVEKLGKKGV